MSRKEQGEECTVDYVCISGKCEDGFCAEKPGTESSKEEDGDGWRAVVLFSAIMLFVIGGMCQIIINHFK